MARPRKPDSERRSKLFYVRLLPREMEELARAARERHLSVADILRNGAALYLSTGTASPAKGPGPAGD